MNIIRTKVVELSALPAMAYKIRLKQGGSGIKIHRTDKEVAAFAEINKRSGEILPEAYTADFPEEAFTEALELLVGLPYSARGKVKIGVCDTVDTCEIEVPEDEAPGAHQDPLANAADSDEYNALVAMYSDVSGKMNYPLMNKQFIQFVSKNKTVSKMVGEKASEQDLLLYIVKNRAAFFAGKRDDLSDTEAAALIEAIEEIDPRGAFKELKLHLRRMMR
ncbi:MAG: hypothetical protein FWG87_10335 [Defluviitaleaceae bacterium]|nr:hypothetical protein [Defluviitaleaceae bacterium]